MGFYSSAIYSRDSYFDSNIVIFSLLLFFQTIGHPTILIKSKSNSSSALNKWKINFEWMDAWKWKFVIFPSAFFVLLFSMITLSFSIFLLWRQRVCDELRKTWRVSDSSSKVNIIKQTSEKPTAQLVSPLFHPSMLFVYIPSTMSIPPWGERESGTEHKYLPIHKL